MTMKKIKWILFALLILSAGLYLYAWVSLPTEYFEASMSAELPEEENRASMGGFILLGPPIQRLIFDVDKTAPGVKPLDWKYMRDIGPGGYVEAHFRIDQNGEVQDLKVSHRGAAKLAEYVQSVLISWKYKPYMFGDLYLILNIASRGLIVGGDLQVIPAIKEDPYSIVLRGRCFYGINMNRVDVAYQF
jgi:hypothetical protein